MVKRTLNCIVIYDIIDDNLRVLLSETLKDYGLKRIQKSAFMGTLQKHFLNSLLTDLHKMITKSVDKVIVFCLCDLDCRNITSIGQVLLEEENKEVEFY
jgi:CRISPR-associated protein Cas2